MFLRIWSESSVGRVSRVGAIVCLSETVSEDATVHSKIGYFMYVRRRFVVSCVTEVSMSLSNLNTCFASNALNSQCYFRCM